MVSSGNAALVIAAFSSLYEIQNNYWSEQLQYGPPNQTLPRRLHVAHAVLVTAWKNLSNCNNSAMHQPILLALGIDKSAVDPRSLRNG